MKSALVRITFEKKERTNSVICSVPLRFLEPFVEYQTCLHFNEEGGKWFANIVGTTIVKRIDNFTEDVDDLIGYYETILSNLKKGKKKMEKGDSMIGDIY